jgi:hypothetical protein
VLKEIRLACLWLQVWVSGDGGEEEAAGNERAARPISAIKGQPLKTRAFEVYTLTNTPQKRLIADAASFCVCESILPPFLGTSRFKLWDVLRVLVYRLGVCTYGGLCCLQASDDGTGFLKGREQGHDVHVCLRSFGGWWDELALSDLEGYRERVAMMWEAVALTVCFCFYLAAIISIFVRANNLGGIQERHRKA